MREEGSTEVERKVQATTEGEGKAQPSQGKPSVVLLLLLVLCFFGLVVGSLPFIWLIVPGMYISLTGQVAHGVYYQIKDCHFTDDNASDTNGEVFESTVLYRDTQGQLQETTTGNDCTSFFDIGPDPIVNGARASTNGKPVTIRYLPGLPGTTVADGSFWGFVLWGGIILQVPLYSLGGFLYLAHKLIRRCQRTEQYTRLRQAVLGCLVVLVPLALLLWQFPPPINQAHNGPTQNFRPGQTVDAEQRWAVTIQGALPGQALLTRSPDAGNLCLELKITLSNLTRQPLAFAPEQFTLYDVQITPRSVPCALDVSPLASATVAPGATLEGVSAFEVPASARQFYLAFRPNPQGEENVGRYFWTIHAT
ncbi:MAG TPA: DUF4352 domain-containing protein [Ktedonobacterales bacterium]|nr:DUF4352 domain-containing protein [Ktedonobacterales bacterium]